MPPQKGNPSCEYLKPLSPFKITILEKRAELVAQDIVLDCVDREEKKEDLLYNPLTATPIKDVGGYLTNGCSSS